MKPNQLINRWGWLGASLGGLLWIGFHLWYIWNDPQTEFVAAVVWAAGIASLLMIAGALSLRSQARHSGVRIGLAVMIAGLGLFALGTFLTSAGMVWAWLVAILGEMITSLGLLTFGAANLAERLLGGWFWLPLGMLVFYVNSLREMAAFSLPLENPAEWLAVVYGLGWVLIGIVLLSKKEDGVFA